MSAELTDLQQRLANLFRAGTVQEVDLPNSRVRVAFGAGNVSDWVPWMTSRAGGVREWNPPSVGEQVCLICPGGTGNAGFILKGGIYKEGYAANGTAPDRVEIDIPPVGAWIVRCGLVTVEITATGVNIIGPVNIVGPVHVTGTVTASAFTVG